MNDETFLLVNLHDNVMSCRDQQPECPCFGLDSGGSKLYNQ